MPPICIGYWLCRLEGRLVEKGCYLVRIAVDVRGPGAAAYAVSGFEEEGFEACRL